MSGLGDKPPSSIRIRRRVVVTVMALVAIAAVPVWNTLSRKAESEKLLARIIRYHKWSSEFNGRLYQGGSSVINLSIRRAWKAPRVVAAAFRRAMNPPEKPEPFTQMPGDDWLDCYYKAQGMVQIFSTAYERFWDATFRKNMSDYHKHAQEYYERLLDARVTKLPPFPAHLEAERSAIEESVRRKIGIAYWDSLDPPPPSSLMPGAPRLRPYDRALTAEETTE